jgi:hypothetical protein
MWRPLVENSVVAIVAVSAVTIWGGASQALTGLLLLVSAIMFWQLLVHVFKTGTAAARATGEQMGNESPVGKKGGSGKDGGVTCVDLADATQPLPTKHADDSAVTSRRQRKRSGAKSGNGEAPGEAGSGGAASSRAASNGRISNGPRLPEPQGQLGPAQCKAWLTLAHQKLVEANLEVDRAKAEGMDLEAVIAARESARGYVNYVLDRLTQIKEIERQKRVKKAQGKPSSAAQETAPKTGGEGLVWGNPPSKLPSPGSWDPGGSLKWGPPPAGQASALTSAWAHSPEPELGAPEAKAFPAALALPGPPPGGANAATVALGEQRAMQAQAKHVQDTLVLTRAMLEATKAKEEQARNAHTQAMEHARRVKEAADEEVRQAKEAASEAAAEAMAARRAAEEAIASRGDLRTEVEHEMEKARRAMLRECPMCLMELDDPACVGVHALVPCGHSMCAECAPGCVAKPCPVCSVVVSASLRVYF